MAVHSEGAQPDVRAQAEAACDVVRWFHSIRLAPGVVTAGDKSATQLDAEWRSLHYPTSGARVCSTWPPGTAISRSPLNGPGQRVVALDGYAWSVNWRAVRRPTPPRWSQGSDGPTAA